MRKKVLFIACLIFISSFNLSIISCSSNTNNEDSTNKDVEIYSTNKIDDEEMIESLINTIFDGGVYGKKDMTSNFTNQVAFNYKGKDYVKKINFKLNSIFFRFIKTVNLNFFSIIPPFINRV